jgi:hypothetical protein
MRKSDIQKYEERVVQLKKRVDAQEWDFTKVPREEEHACCYYEYARESSWIMEEVDKPVEVVRHGWRAFERPPPNKEAVRRDKLSKSLLTYALPPVRPICGKPVGRQKIFDGRPWLKQEPEWRQEFCQNVEKYKDRLGFARILKKTPDRAFCVGIALPFPWQRWEEEHEKRILDRDTGLEVLLVTVDWGNFKDSEIIKQFRIWLKSKEGRPKDVGLRTGQGKRTDAWRKKLERLAVLRLRRHYTLDEMAPLLPKEWYGDMFADNTEAERGREAARKTLFELYPFLPKKTKPINWS